MKVLLYSFVNPSRTASSLNFVIIWVISMLSRTSMSATSRLSVTSLISSSTSSAPSMSIGTLVT